MGLNTWKHFVMPVMALSFYPTAYIMRLMRSSMLDVLGQDYMRTAKAKGLSGFVSLFKHALRNAILPVITYVVLTGTDLMLWALSSAGIGSFYEMEMYNPFEGVFPQEMYYDAVQQQLYSMPIFDTIISFMNAIAYSMMFNTIFRKNKVLKTILFNISMSFAFVILMSVIINTVSVEFWEEMADKLVDWLKDMEIEDFMEYIRAAGRYLTILFIAIFLSITYFRIKKVNY